MSQQQTLPEIRKTVVINAPIENVWKSVSTSQGIASWWMPNTFEPVVGREFILHAGQFGDSPCKVTAIDPPHRVEFDWDTDWHVSFELKQLEEGITEFTLVHSGWDPAKTTKFGQPHAMIRGIMDGGWEKIVREALPAAVEG